MKWFRIALLFFVAGLFGSGNSLHFSQQYLENDISGLVEFYKDLHGAPEIAHREEATSAKLATELEKLGFEVTRNVGGFGIVGILKNGKGPQILYRTDMDALPMYEKTSLPYSSKVEIDYRGAKTGTMHSCGHDIHMTTWVGVARAMAQNKKKWSGTLMMVGQPAEETGEGARMMLKDGLYQRFGTPDMAVGLHSNSELKIGSIGVEAGYTMATTEMVDMEVYGVGAHGASPHLSIDPVVLASKIIMDFQTIVSRNLKPIDDAVITVGAIHGGTANNIIPDQVSLKLTIRTFKPEVRELVHKRMLEICAGAGRAAGLPEDKWPVIKFPEEFTPANLNSSELVNKLRLSAGNILGKEQVIATEPQMVGEDFALYGQFDKKIPTVLFWLGTVTQEKIDKKDLPGLHSPFYYPEPEKSIETGVKVASAYLTDLFNGK